MSRTLYRPMFRRGGSTGEGITSGLAPRQRYENAGDVQSNFEQEMLQKIAGTKIELPKSTAGADFWLNLGPNILAQPGGKPILQTLGIAGKEPLARFQQQRAAEDRLKYQHQVGSRAFMLEAWKALNDDERLDIQKKARLAFENGDFDSYEEALSEFINASIYTKSGHYRPEVQERKDKEKADETYAEKIKRIQDKVAKEAGEDIPPHWAKHISNFYDWAAENSDTYKIDNTQPFIDFMEGTAESFKYDDDENIILAVDVVDSYMDGIAYVDPNTGKIYYKEKGNARLVLITQDEEIIKP